MGAVLQMVGGVSVQSSLQACSMKYSALLLLSLSRGLPPSADISHWCLLLWCPPHLLKACNYLLSLPIALLQTPRCLCAASNPQHNEAAGLEDPLLPVLPISLWTHQLAVAMFSDLLGAGQVLLHLGITWV